MAKALTISVDDDHLARAERLAAGRGLPLAAWVEDLVRRETPPDPIVDDAAWRASLPPITRSAMGMLGPMPTGRPDDEVLTDELMKKYGFEP